MDAQAFSDTLDRLGEQIEAIRQAAHKLHADVNQTYDHTHPYGFHLDMVADNVRKFGAEAVATPDDVAAVMFGAYFHDSIEDARLTYNNVLKLAQKLVGEGKAELATEIVYALTNEKGRNRAERADERYYAGIRATPYAPMVKLADRLANTEYSCRYSNDANRAMCTVYSDEMPHFLASIAGEQVLDRRLSMPSAMLMALEKVIEGRK